MYKFRLKASAFAMSYLSNEERVRELARQIAPYRGDKPAPFISAGGLKVAAARPTVRRYPGPRAYVEDQNEPVARAAAAGCQLVAFPELGAMSAISLLPGFSALYADLTKLWASGSQSDRAEAFAELCATVQGFVGEVFLNTFSQLARSHRIIIAAGGLYQIENGRLTNRQYLFSDTGEVAAVQDKLYPERWERSMGVSAGEELTPGDTRIGRVALLTASCLPNYEPFFIASAAGCSVAVAGASPFGPSSDLARYRAQESGLCLLSPGLRSRGDFGFEYHYPARISAPRAATRSRDGSAASPEDRPLLTARVDLERAASQFDLYSADRNPAFFRALIAGGEGPAPKEGGAG